MKIRLRWTVALASLALACGNGPALAQDDQDEFGGGDGSGGKETQVGLIIHADGSCLFTTIAVEPRTQAEQQVRTRERYRKMSEAENAGENPAPASLTSTNDATPFTDEELIKKISEPLQERAENLDQKFKVELKRDDVITTTTRSFASLEEMLKESYAIWSAGGVQFENVRAETDTNGFLRLTLTPQSGMARYLKTMRAQWKLSGAKTELRLVFPGKVISSGFPAMETNATMLALDPKKDESLETLNKLYSAPTVITAELGGLKLEQPLEAIKLWRARRQPAAGADDQPITEAGPGFLAEALSITTTSLHVFPGGEAYFKQSPVATGAVVNVKLFAPRGRTLKSVSDVRVLSAVDNQGRSVLSPADDGESFTREYFGGGRQDTSSQQLQLRLQLPPPDAKSIEKLSAEAVAVTVGDWKEMTLTNLAAIGTNELDLSAVLPGAKLVITKFTSKANQISLQATLQGPPTLNRLELRIKIPDNNQYNSSTSDRSTRTKAGQTTRTIVVQGYDFSGDKTASLAAVLVIRYPTDQQRERVKFELKALDLL